MCPSAKLLSQTKNGVITYCGQSLLFQIVYNNLCFELFEWELESLKQHILSLDINFWENQLKSSVTHRKIPLSVGTKHFIILLSKDELIEFKTLLNISDKGLILLNFDDIDYRLIEN